MSKRSEARRNARNVATEAAEAVEATQVANTVENAPAVTADPPQAIEADVTAATVAAINAAADAADVEAPLPVTAPGWATAMLSDAATPATEAAEATSQLSFMNETFDGWLTLNTEGNPVVPYVPPVFMAVGYDGKVHDPMNLPEGAVTYVTAADHARLVEQGVITHATEAYCLCDMGDLLMAVDALGVYRAGTASKRRLALACYLRADATALSPAGWAACYMAAGYANAETQFNIISPKTGNGVVKLGYCAKYEGVAADGRKSHGVTLTHKGTEKVRQYFAAHNKPLPAVIEFNRIELSNLRVTVANEAA